MTFIKANVIMDEDIITHVQRKCDDIIKHAKRIIGTDILIVPSQL
jgi:hypothetical protein